MAIADPSIAVNRFGLGLQANEPIPADGAGWLREQLDRYDPAPPAIRAAPGLDVATRYLQDYREAGPAVRAARRSASDGERPGTGAVAAMAARGAVRSDIRLVLRQSIEARAAAAIASPTPFVERLVHFWSNHFAVSTEKLPVQALGGRFEFDAIRPHVLGRFADMVRAVERHPAMLVFLDQAQSIGPNSVAGQRAAARGAKRGLNENLAREIMELHTLGVRSGYSQADVTELARALTGWTATGINAGAARAAEPPARAGFAFRDAWHEPGIRTILGRTYGAGGVAQADAVLATLATYPATATHIATKLARHFAGDAPPPALIERLAAAFRRSSGDLPTVYRALIDSPEAWVRAPAKFKTPWEWAISAGRALGAEALPGNAVGFVGQLGQRVWQPGSPAGFDDIAAAWAGPDAILRRVEAAERLAARTRQPVDARGLAARMFGDRLSAATAASLARAESPGQATALLLVSPEFLRR